MASPLMEWFPFIPRLAFSFLQTQVLISLVPGPVRKEVYYFPLSPSRKERKLGSSAIDSLFFPSGK